jgi:hypothetical protein
MHAMHALDSMHHVHWLAGRTEGAEKHNLPRTPRFISSRESFKLAPPDAMIIKCKQASAFGTKLPSVLCGIN